MGMVSAPTPPDTEKEFAGSGHGEAASDRIRGSVRSDGHADGGVWQQ
jgi:hypothetical protein